MELVLRIKVNNRGKVQIVPLESSRITLGRDSGNRICVAEPQISSRHAVILRDESGQYFIEDGGSTHGTFVNGQRVLHGKVPFQAGDSLKLADLSFEVAQRDAKKEAIFVVPLRDRRKVGHITTP